MTDWVLQRAKCTADEHFTRIVKRLKKDLAAFNSLSLEARKNRDLVSTLENGVFRIERRLERREDGIPYADPDLEAPPPIEVAKRDGLFVCVSQQGRKHFKILPKWNAAKLECELMVGDEPCALWGMLYGVSARRSSAI